MEVAPSTGTSTRRSARTPPDWQRLLVALIAMGAVISATAIPGIFSTDEDSYLINIVALRHGHVTVTNTAGLPPSRELLFFDPGPWSRAVPGTPVASVAPPLYAPIALPFSFLGLRGLITLNTLAYLLTTAMVFFYARRYSERPLTPWVAAAAFALGGYSIEYAYGIWPHSLSVALCTAGILAAGLALDGCAPIWGAAAGFLIAIATGIRYQNALILAVVGGALMLWAPRRARSLAGFGAAASLPLAVSAAFNRARLGSWNPVSKGPGYLALRESHGSARFVHDAFIMFWARVVDHSTRPSLSGPGTASWLSYDPVTGAHVVLGMTIKKALLQSAPWAIVALVLFVLAWNPLFRMEGRQRRQLQLFSLATAATFGVFAISGVTRYSGMDFNQRYFAELVPLAAIAFGFALDRHAVRCPMLLAGGTAAATLGIAVIAMMPARGGPAIPLWVLRHRLLLYVPLLAAAGLASAWLMAGARGGSEKILGLLAGACIGWALAVHLGSDLMSSFGMRAYNRARSAALAPVLTDGTALMTYSGAKDATGPLLFDRDIVVLDTHADDGTDATMMIRALLRQRRKVYLLAVGLPPTVKATAIRGLTATPVTGVTAPMFELHEAGRVSTEPPRGVPAP